MIGITNVSLFHDVLRKICQSSPVVSIEKTEALLTISAVSSTELHSISVDFKKTFFENWTETVTGVLEIEAKTLYEVTNLIQKTSSLSVDISELCIKFEINDRNFKKVTLKDLKKKERTELKLFADTSIKVKSERFLGTITEISSVLDEMQLSIKKGTSRLLFSGKKMGFSLKVSPQETLNSQIDRDICIEFPVKGFQRFMPLFSNFEELTLSFADTTPLVIEGSNDNLRVVLIVSKVEAET